MNKKAMDKMFNDSIKDIICPIHNKKPIFTSTRVGADIKFCCEKLQKLAEGKAEK